MVEVINTSERRYVVTIASPGSPALVSFVPGSNILTKEQFDAVKSHEFFRSLVQKKRLVPPDIEDPMDRMEDAAEESTEENPEESGSAVKRSRRKKGRRAKSAAEAPPDDLSGLEKELGAE
jgi:hypothetical protein